VAGCASIFAIWRRNWAKASSAMKALVRMAVQSRQWESVPDLFY
jgi:hypothetical protein